MRPTLRLANRLTASLALLLGVGIPFLADGQTVPGKAEVRGITGTATYSTAGGPGVPLKVGVILTAGATIKTGPESSVDLFMGNSAGVIRVAESTTLSLDKLALTDTGADTAVDIQINLPDGQMYFNVNKLSQASRYEIKVPNGVAGIRGTKGSGRSDSTWVLLEGTLIFVHSAANGKVTPHVLKAPPPVYFSPKDGLIIAPEDLTRRVAKVTDDMQKKGKFVPPGPPAGVPKSDPFISPGTPPAK